MGLHYIRVPYLVVLPECSCLHCISVRGARTRIWGFRGLGLLVFKVFWVEGAWFRVFGAWVCEV